MPAEVVRNDDHEVMTMIKFVRARHEAGMRFAITTGSGHTLAIDDADGYSAETGEVVVAGPREDPDALGQRSLDVAGAG